MTPSEKEEMLAESSLMAHIILADRQFLRPGVTPL